MTIKNQFAINSDKRKVLGEDFRLEGVGLDNNDGITGPFFNELIFKTSTDHIWGTESQVKLVKPKATFYTDSSGDKFDKDDVAVAFTDDDRIVIVYDTALIANLVLDGGGKRLDIKTDRGLTMLLGADAGNSNVPFKIQLLNADRSKVDIYTDKDFTEVISVKAAATRVDKSVFSNQTLESTIKLNGRLIFGRNRYESKLSKTLDPYSIHLDGTNDLLQDEYKDLFTEIGLSSTAGLDSAITNGFFSVPNYLGRVSRAGNGSSSIAPDSHTRTGTSSFPDWPNTVTNISASLTTGANTITVDATAAGTEADNLLFLQNCIGMRCKSASAGIPDDTSGTPVTSIIQSVDISTPSAVILTLVDSITAADADATATASEDLTISNSGDCLGSIELDGVQNFQIGALEDLTGARTAYAYARNRDIRNGSGAALVGEALTGINTGFQGSARAYVPLNNGTDGDPRVGAQTKMINIVDFKYFLL